MRPFAVLTVFLMALLSACSNGSRVELVLEDGRYSLHRNGAPYAIKGVGIDSGSLRLVAVHGGNSVRTWRTDDAQAVLDEARERGLTVLMGLEIGRERHGFDYDDAPAVAAQLEFARREVQKYKEHPALLGWIIGNEPNLSFTNPRVFDAINDISRMIHEVDGRHPTTVALAGFSKELADLVEQRAPDLDFVSIQLYGALVDLPKLLDDIGFDRPFMVTEWGTVGHWEVERTEWGAPIEKNSSEKAANYLKSYETVIASNPRQVIGSYVFFWGQKQERTPTWYGMFLADGSETETIDVMHFIWNGAWPENRSPRVDDAMLDSKTAYDSVVLSAGRQYEASIAAEDPDGDTLTYRWEVMRESEATQEGGDPEEMPETVANLIEDPARSTIVLTAPAEPGAYRLFVYVHDGNRHAGHANVPFYVQ